VLSEAPADTPAILRHRIDLADIRDSYLSQQRGDVVRMSYRPEASD
jgi:hypothetical protein